MQRRRGEKSGHTASRLEMLPEERRGPDFIPRDCEPGDLGLQLPKYQL